MSATIIDINHHSPKAFYPCRKTAISGYEILIYEIKTMFITSFVHFEVSGVTIFLDTYCKYDFNYLKPSTINLI